MSQRDKAGSQVQEGAKGGMQLYKTFAVDDVGKISEYSGATLKATVDGLVELLIYSAEDTSKPGSIGHHRYTIPVARLIELIGERGLAR